MAKKIINSTKDTDLKVPETKEQVTALATQVLFEPNKNQQKAKARFWARYQPSPFSAENGITMATALEVAKIPQIRKWWSDEGFRDWFLNKDSEREYMKYLFNLSLQSAEDILLNPDANHNAKVNTIKMLAEMNGYLGKKQADKFADEEIQKMSEHQLKAFLEAKGVKFGKEETVLDVNAEEKESKQ